MISLTLSTALLLAGPHAADELFPPAHSDVVIEISETEENRMSLYALAMRYGDATGQTASFAMDTETLLKNNRVPVADEMLIKAADLQFMFETMMRSCDFIIEPGGTEEARVFKVSSLHGRGGRSLLSRATQVDFEEVRTLAARHPAVLLSTVTTLECAEAGGVAGALRGQFGPGSSIVAVGDDNALIVTGIGEGLIQALDLLETVDRAVARRRERLRPGNEVVRLEHRDPNLLAEVVRNLYGYELQKIADDTETRTPLLVTDEHSRSIILRGSSRERAELRELIEALDVPGPR